MKTVIFISLRTIEEVETKYEICPRATKRERWKTEGDDKAVDRCQMAVTNEGCRIERDKARCGKWCRAGTKER